ncbi:phage protein Gp27 family protein [Methylobacterium sp. Leaf85]|uniref:phage protein Gp27 family protein n=1 Tax=Methylobacterium sp. Leaf85 TaxID=1736241 RepID=UPI0006F29CC6|nr:phage protein Gp27 family protein [Methylobacterium sp. Leaf85]KQO53083.1 hypothetical protein ASF08_19350 [Methylobacterium sp. Leaf85]
MAERRRLSSIDMLPEEAADDIVWATQQLAQRTRTQQDILFELNDRLEAKGIEGVSKSAFSRHSVNRAAAQRRMQEARAMFEGVSSQFTAADVDENTIILGEFIKTLIIELAGDGAGVKTPKDAMELARAFQSTVSAQKISSDRRQKVEAEMQARLEKATDTAIDAVAQEKGLSGDTVRGIKERILGLKLPKPAAP